MLIARKPDNTVRVYHIRKEKRMKKSRILVTCPKRMTLYVRQELQELGYPIMYESMAGVFTEGTLHDTMILNLRMRTASRILLLLKECECDSPADLYYHTSKIAWEDIIPRQNGYLSVISAVDTPSIDNTQFANVKCKDAIVDRIRQKTGKRPDSGSDNDYTVIFLYWKDTDCCIYLDTSGTPLSRRGYRMMPHAAPMRETLAAATILATRWDKQSSFINPMCGSGTLAIEAALIATQRAPGLLRPNFGFMHVQDYNHQAWIALRENTESAIIPFESRIIASDRDAKAVQATRENAKKAGVAHLIKVSRCDFSETEIPYGNGTIMLNPEYGKRLGDDEKLLAEYQRIGNFFKQRCSGYMGYIFTGNLELAKHVGLKAKRRIEFFNADIDCRLLEFELYEGKKQIIP